MIESEVIDVRCGEPHVTAEQIMDVNIGTYGDEDYVLSTGKKVTAELVTNNSVRVFDGVMVYGGIRDAVPVNKYYDISIDNGAQGKNRNDIIVRKFVRGEGTSGTGAASFTVVKGVPVSGAAVDPEIAMTNLREGALTHDMLLHRVRLEGLNIVAVEPLYKVLYNAAEIQDMVTELNRKLPSGIFSSEEILTGETWIDGKPIYRRTFVTTETVGTGASLEILLGLSGTASQIWIDTQNSYIQTIKGDIVYPLPLARYATSSNYIGVWCNSSAIRIYSDSGWNENWKKVVTVRYTKL